MHAPIHNPAELRQRGFEAIVDALGWANAVRFLHLYESGQGDYTAERDQILPDLSMDEMLDRARDIQRRAKGSQA